MITETQEYLNLLHRVQDPNRRTKSILLPENETPYIINLDTRKIDAPEFLSIERDHNAETVYFEVDRFFDNVDLSTMFCVIQYQNANPNTPQGGYIYPVPYFDIITKASEKKMLFQWAIEGPATAYAGKVTFSVKFYKVSTITIDYVDGSSEQKVVYDYVLNTLPKESKVLHGFDILATSENYYFDASEIETIYQRIEEVRRQSDLYWIVLTDPSETASESSDYPTGTINKNNTITDLIT